MIDKRLTVDTGPSQDVNADSSRVFIDIIGHVIVHDCRDLHPELLLQEAVMIRTDIISDPVTIGLHEALKTSACRYQRCLTTSVADINVCGDFKS